MFDTIIVMKRDALQETIPSRKGDTIFIADFTTPGESHFVWPSPIPLQTP